MKHFIGVCCAMLLCLSACGDIDSPEFPPSRVEVGLKPLMDMSFSELRELETSYNMVPDYYRAFYKLSANIVLDSPYQSFNYVQFYISPVKDNLSENDLLMYSYDYDAVYSVYMEYWNGTNVTSFWTLDNLSWETGTYYYRAVAYSSNWERGPGILDDCLQQDNRQATFSEIKSFTIPSKNVPYIDYGYESGEQMMYVHFNLYEFKETLAKIGVCINDGDAHKLPTTENETHVADLTDVADRTLTFSYAPGQPVRYIRPFVVTQAKDTVYGYVQPFQYSR